MEILKIERFGFKPQDRVLDIMENMVYSKTRGRVLLDKLLRTGSKSKKGFIFEGVINILALTRCLVLEDGVYDICEGRITDRFEKVSCAREFLDKPIQQGNNSSDLTLKLEDKYIHFSVKYRNDYVPDILGRIPAELQGSDYESSSKIGIFVKDKSIYETHRFTDPNNSDRRNLVEIMGNKLLFDASDVANALDTFAQRYREKGNLDAVLKYIDTDILGSERKHLRLKLHQKMNLLKFIESIKTNRRWCLSHKPRSGKSITILSMCSYLLDQGQKRILIATSVPSTIKSFQKDIKEYKDFDMNSFHIEGRSNEVEEDFVGIVFCSVQYLKANMEEKREWFRQNAFETIVIDESHLGSSTEKTKKGLDIDTEFGDALVIFASGTSDKTLEFYRVAPSCNYEWDMIDETYMKIIHEPDAYAMMVCRHGSVFAECMRDGSLDKDYSKHPTQVLMKRDFPEGLKREIEEYNADPNNTPLGFSVSSLFALRQYQDETKKISYLPEFEIDSGDGTDLLKGFFESIISKNMNKRDTIMKKIHDIQRDNGSRQSSVETPQMFICYLPIHTGDSNIRMLQEAIFRFLKKHNLWGDYTIAFANGMENMIPVMREGKCENRWKEETEYNAFLEKCMEATKMDRKLGCILLLGGVGGVGVTYPHCDVTISMDDGHSLNTQIQRNSRALTDQEGKTIGINVDMNVQRAYNIAFNIARKFKCVSQKREDYADVLAYMYHKRIFLFDPDAFKTNCTSRFILEYYKEKQNEYFNGMEGEILDSIACDDLLNGLLGVYEEKTHAKEKVDGLEGDSSIPKPGNEKQLCDPVNPTHTPIHALPEEEQIVIINKTKIMCKTFMFPLLAILSTKTFRSLNLSFVEILNDERSCLFVEELIKEKLILKNHQYEYIKNIMEDIIGQNEEIVARIRNIYETADSHHLRKLIEKHFIPTIEERKNNAEIPTPVSLVDEMLSKMPEDFWTTPKKVFEPCCGKGNFVLGIFDKFWEGLEISENEEKCRVIIDCLYFADISPLNVFITTEILKCHAQSYCGLECECDFHSNVGNTLDIVSEEWRNFDAVIGNPPYQTNNASGDNKLYLEFIRFSFGIIKPDMFLLFVTPTNVKNYLTNKDKNRNYIDGFHEIVFLSINAPNRHFNGISTYFAYFLLRNKIVSSCVVDVEFMRNKTIETSTIDIHEKQELPLCLASEDMSIIRKCSSFMDKNGCNFDIKKAKYSMNGRETSQRIRKTHIASGEISTTMFGEYQYKIIDKINKTNSFPGVLYYNKHSMIDHGLPKIIMCTGGYLMPSYDRDGIYNLSDNMIYMLCDSEEKFNGFVKLVNSKLVKYLNKITMTDNLHGRDNVIQSMKFLDLEKITDDQSIFTIYGFTEKEIDVILKI